MYKITAPSQALTRAADVHAQLEAGDPLQAARMHPLVPFLADCVRQAFAELRATHLSPHGPLKDCLAQMRGNRGSLVGTLFEFLLTKAVSENGFRGQESKHETDLVSLEDRTFDFELKTTSSATENVFGNRIAASADHKRGSFLLAVSYDMASLEVRRMRFGWVTPADWIPQRGNGQQARLTEAARSRFIIL